MTADGPAAPADSGGAAVSFGSAIEASSHVAGIPAAARVVRELADRGFSGAILVIPDAEGLTARTKAEIDRFRGGLEIRIRTDLPDGQAAMTVADLLPSAEAILRASGKTSDGPVSRWLNRPISRQLTRLLLRISGIRPIHATLGTVLIGLAMFAALMTGTEAGLLAGALLFHAASVFDGVDGEMARVTYRCTPAGAVLDSCVDVVTNVLLILGVTINLAGRGESLAPILSVWGFVLFLAGLALIAGRAARLDGPFSLDLVKHLYGARFHTALAGRIIRFLTVVSSRDFFALLFALLVVAGLPMAVLYLFAAAATVWILFVGGSFLLPVAPAPLRHEGY